ncbi:MAG: serine O-acetyltransferase, partial [Parvularculaceae bacterium]
MTNAAPSDSESAAAGKPPRLPVSAGDPDWSRERARVFWDPGRKLLKTLRDYVRLGAGDDPFTAFRRSMIVTRHRFWSAVTSCDIPLGFDPGGGFLMPHPSGIVIHPGSVVGPNCLLMHQTTLGAARGNRRGTPTLGGHVDVGAGAKIIGAVTVGDHAIIGANAVVLIDVPAGATAAGVPARIIAPDA